MISSFSLSPADQQQSQTIDSDIYRVSRPKAKQQSQGFTDHQSAHELAKHSELSEIILHCQDFWLKKTQHNQEEISIEFPKRPQMLKNCSVGIDVSLGEESVNSKKDLLLLDSRVKDPWPCDLGIMTPSESSEFEKQSASQQLKYLITDSAAQIGQQYFNSAPNTEIVLDSQEIKLQLKKTIRYLEQIAELGYWCHLAFNETSADWKPTCLLLYKEVTQKINVLNQKNPHSQDKKTALSNLDSLFEQMNLEQELNKNILKTLRAKQAINLCPYILKESQILVKKLMKVEFNSKTSQFLLFKVTRAVNLAAKINGCLKNAAALADDGEFSIKGLKANLVLYKELIQEMGGKCL